MKIGYARVSTADQNLDLQIDALKIAGCEVIFKEHITGKNTERPELQKMLAQLRSGDQMVVWKLDRLGRSLKDLIDLVAGFNENKVDFISLNESINTSTPAGKLIFTLFASLAEFEKDIIKERTKAGLSAAKARGRTGGKKKGLTPAAIEKAKAASQLYNSEGNNYNYKEVAEILNIGTATCYRYVQYIKGEQQKKVKSKPEAIDLILEEA
jgi:DNA invertase Pin-like site-specific DNA recombinase